MITYKTGNIFDSDADILVNPVNNVGVAGAGLAKQFKIRYPEANDYYVEQCKKGSLVGMVRFLYTVRMDFLAFYFSRQNGIGVIHPLWN